MKKETIRKIELFFAENPIAIGKNSSITEIKSIEEELGLNIDDTHKYLLLNYGGVLIGNFRIYGMRNSIMMDDDTFIDLTKQAIKDGIPMKETQYVISFDDSGDPILIDSQTKTVSLFNYDTGELEKLSNSLEDLILEILR